MHLWIFAGKPSFDGLKFQEYGLYNPDFPFSVTKVFYHIKEIFLYGKVYLLSTQKFHKIKSLYIAGTFPY
jgi:hypothetical protein